eukprot:534568-Rhodomonas_salina.7
MTFTWGSRRVLWRTTRTGMMLRVWCYVLPGTDVLYGASRLRACYALSGTDRGYAASSKLYIGRQTSAQELYAR